DRPSPLTRALDELSHGGVNGLDVLAVDGLSLDAEGPGAGQDLTGDRLAAGCVLAVQVVLAHVDDRQLPEGGHVHRLVKQALAVRAVAEEARRDLAAAPHLGRQRRAGRDAGRAAHDRVGAEVARLRIGDVHRATLAAAAARILAEQSLATP